MSAMTEVTPMVWLAALILPLLAAAALLVVRAPADTAGRARRGLGLAAELATLVPTALLVAAPPSGVVRIPFLIGEATFHLDAVGRPMVAVALVLYAVALAAVARRRTPRAGELSAFLLVCFAANIATFAAADVLTFYLAFAALSYAAVGLVLHGRTAPARRAAVVYMALAVLSESATLAALLLVAGAGGTELADAPAAVAASEHGGLIAGLLILGFGVKAGLVPLHVWLPLAHPAAPPAASAVLSGAMVKAGVVGWLRFLPLGEVSLPAAGTVLVIAGVVGAFGAVLVGVGQTEPKTVLAYSTVSQLGYLAIVIGVALAVPRLAPACIAAAVVYAVHHALAKGAAFLGVAVWKHQAVGRRRLLVAAGLLVAGTAIVGAPFSSGAVGKYATKYAIEGVVVLGVDLVDVLPFVATGSTLLLLRVAVLLHRSQLEVARNAADPEFLSWLVLVAACIPVSWFVAEHWVPVADVPDLDLVTLWDATWPVLVGLALGPGAWALRHALAGLPVAPAGDLVVVYADAVRAAGRAWADRPRRPGRPGPSGTRVKEESRAALVKAEGVVASWGVGIGATVVLAALLILGGT